MQISIRLIKVIIVMAIVVPALNGCTVYNAARDERSVGTFIDDKKIAGKIKYALIRDEKVKGLDISVQVYEGRAYLVGVVENDTQKSRAVKIAKETDEVRSVSTYLLDKKAATVGKAVDDAAITAKVKAKMVADKEMKATQVNVETVLGHVVLLGIVGSQKDADKAVRFARSVEHVRKVKNFISVGPGNVELSCKGN